MGEEIWEKGYGKEGMGEVWEGGYGREERGDGKGGMGKEMWERGDWRWERSGREDARKGYGGKRMWKKGMRDRGGGVVDVLDR